ncbi:hypothetical protein, partial [Salmonella sp. NW1149]|uniref:hypothetical protein n=1 Tax=Salmonella sp. NW1149 TaxID=2947583 RepID=UPI003F45D623
IYAGTHHKIHTPGLFACFHDCLAGPILYYGEVYIAEKSRAAGLADMIAVVVTIIIIIIVVVGVAYQGQGL